MLRRKPNRVLLAILLVMLAASAALLVFVFKASYRADDYGYEHESAPRWESPSAEQSYDRPKPPQKIGAGPGWWGIVSLSRAADQKLTVTIKPMDTSETMVQITSFQVFLQTETENVEKDLTAGFTKDDKGVLAATLEGIAKGAKLRIRLHRRLQTLEFTQRIDN